MKRFLLVALVVIVVLAGGGALLLRYYLHSSRVTSEVATRLEAIYGGPVRVGSVDVGLGGSSLSGFELFEPGSDASTSEPWLKIGSLNTDVSFWDFVRGQARPTRVEGRNARVVLHFDADGRLLTRFPGRQPESAELTGIGEFPEVVLEQGEVVLRRAGQPGLVVRNVSAHLSRGADGKLALSGSGENAELGKLALSGSMDPATTETVASLKTGGTVHVAQAFLDRLPYIPAVTWQEVQIGAGDTPAELTVRYKPGEDPLHFRIALQPEHTTLRVPSLGLVAHDAQGQVVIEDQVVRLSGVRGKAYGGELETDADLDFSGATSKLRFSKIVVRGVNLDDLPDTWDIPTQLRKLFAKGKLSGKARLEVTIEPPHVPPAAVDALVGISASPGFDRWLPAVAVLATFPTHEVHAQSEGKAVITGVAGGTAEIDLKLAPRGLRMKTRPPAANPAASEAGAPLHAPAPATPLVAALVLGTTVLQQAGGDGSYPALNVKVGQAAGALLGGVDTLLRDVVRFGNQVAGSVQQKATPAPANPDAPTNYLDINLKLKDIDLAQFVKSVGLKVDVPVEGKLSLQVKASIPTDKVGDLKQYKARGSAQVTALVVAGVKVDRVDAEVKLAGGVLELTSLEGRLAGADAAGGTFRGKGTVDVAPLGDLRADLTLDRIPLQAASAIAGKAPLGGTVSGQLSLRAPVKQLKTFEALEGSGKLTGDQLTAYGLTLDKASTSVELKAGVLRLPDLSGNLEGTPVTASAELRLGEAYPFKSQLHLKNWDLSRLQKLAAKGDEPPVLLAGSFTTTVDLQGTLKPFKVSASGDASTDGLKVNAFQVANVRFHWSTDADKLELSKVDLRLYGGQATGSAVLPLKPAAAGSVDLKLAGLDGKQLAKDLALPIKIEGAVGGQLKGTLPPAPEGKPRTATMDLDVTAPKLRVQNIPTEQLHGTLEYKSGVIDYKLEGKTLGGTFELDGQIPSPAPVKKESRKSRLRIQNVLIGRLTQALGVQDAAPLTGRLSVELDFTHDTPTRDAEGKGKLRIDNLRLRGTALATSLQGELLLSGGVLRLRELSGDVAQGTMRVQVAYDLHDPERSRFSFILENVEAAQLLAPWLGDSIKGMMHARIRGTLGSTWRGTAKLELTRGEVFGMEVTQWRLPADWTYSPASQRAQLDVHETEAQVARGRIQGKLSASWDYSLRVDGQLRFFGVDLQTLIRPFAGATQVVGGQMSGRFDFSGSEVRSLNDLSGNLVASFSQAQALQMPVLRQITPYIGMGPSTTFQRGDLRARLDRGVLRVQQLALEGGNLQMHADGTINLDGRLGLNVVARTGDVGLPTVRLGVIGLRIPITGPVPIALLQEASTLLANRVVYLEVTGTVQNPTVRVRPLQMLSAEAVRFFLNRSNLPIPLAP